MSVSRNRSRSPPVGLEHTEIDRVIITSTFIRPSAEIDCDIAVAASLYMRLIDSNFSAEKSELGIRIDPSLVLRGHSLGNICKMAVTTLTVLFVFLDDTEPVSLNGETEDDDEDNQKEKESKQESLKISNGKFKH